VVEAAGAALSDVASLRIQAVDYRPDPRFLIEVEATAVFD